MGTKLKSIFCNKTFIWLFLIIMFGACLRLIGLNKSSGMWYDELWTYNIAKQSFPFGMLSKIYYDTHPPLYYFIMHFWMKLFGETDYILRLLSVIFGVLTIPVIYLTGKELNSKSTGLIAALLLSINSLMIYFSQEIRSYSLLTLLCTLSIYFLTKIKNNPNKWNFAGLALINTAILYTHFLGSVFIFFEACIMLIYLFYKDRKSIKSFILVQIICLLSFCLYTPFLVHQYEVINKCYSVYFHFSFWSLIFMFHDWFSPVILNLYHAPIRYYSLLISLYRMTTITHLFSNPLYYFIIFGILPVIIYLFGIVKALIRKNFTLAIFLIAILFFLFEIYSATDNKTNFESRFTILIIPIYILTASYGFSELKNKVLRTALVSSLVFISVFYIFSNPLSAPKILRNGGCKNIIDVTNKYSFDNNAVVIVDDIYKEALKKYYFENNHEKAPNIITLDYYPLIGKIIDPDNKNNGDFMLNHKLFKNFLLSDQINKEFNRYISNDLVKKADYLAITYTGTLLKNEKQIKTIVSSDKLYNNTSTFELYPSKIFNSLNSLAAQNFKLDSVKNKNGWTLYIYKRIK